MSKHLSLDERLDIEKYLNQNKSFKEIGKLIGKNCTTISREVRNHYIVKNSGGIGRRFNNCIYRATCPNRGRACTLNNCSEFKEEKCPLLNKPPYVCNGCSKKSRCTLTKHIYDAIYSEKEYSDTLSETREGILIDKEEIEYLNKLLVPLIKDQGQSIHQAVINNKNKIMCSEKTIYKLVDQNILEVKNIDLPRKVRYRQRRKRVKIYKVDKHCLEGRTYEDYLKYMEEHPDTPVVQMDSVEGRKGGKVLLTIHFVNCSLMLAFLREHNDAQSVIDVFNNLEKILGIDKFNEMFVIILTDNGSEFSNPTEIEFNMETGKQRTRIFYCHPSSPNEKGSCEVNHELIRRRLPKGTSFDNLTQEDINLVMSHVNSYKRKKLNDKSPYFVFSSIYGKDTLDKLGIKEINPNDVNLSESLLKR